MRRPEKQCGSELRLWQYFFGIGRCRAQAGGFARWAQTAARHHFWTGLRGWAMAEQWLVPPVPWSNGGIFRQSAVLLHPLLDLTETAE
jgi:hypothetical protein